jgi:FtsZ-interacting cell division protein YlmF
VSQGHRSTRRPRRREPLEAAGDLAGHSAVRVIPRELVADAIAATERSMEESPSQRFPAVVRPTRAVDVRDVVPRLRAHRPVVLELDRIEDDAQRRRAMDFVAGLAYGLEVGMTGVAHKKHAFLLEPNDGSPRRRHDYRPSNAIAALGAVDASAEAETGRDATAARRPADMTSLCVLCDLRQADEDFAPPLDMVIRRDGSRIHSPAAPVCAHCRATITHWRFVLGWCPECERWGRRSVMSPCGIPYGA